MAAHKHEGGHAPIERHDVPYANDDGLGIAETVDCVCGWIGELRTTVVGARVAWIQHVAEHASLTLSVPLPVRVYVDESERSS